MAIQSLNALDRQVYNPNLEISEQLATHFDKVLQNNPERILMYKGLEKKIIKYLQGNRALDYGAGTGISTSYLASLGLEVKGVDTSSEMLLIARKNCPQIEFQVCENGKVSYETSSFNLIFSSLVLFELSSKEDLISYLLESKRLLTKGGLFIGVTGSESMYHGENFLFFENNYPENINLKSGDLAKVGLKTQEGFIEFMDYYWTKEDYQECFEKAGFELLEANYPLADDDFSPKAIGEKVFPPFIQLIAKAL